MAKAKKPDFTVSGPDVDTGVETANVGLSKATTYAERANVETTFYVRDRTGEIVGHAERDAEGVVRTYRRRG